MYVYRNRLSTRSLPISRIHHVSQGRGRALLRRRRAWQQSGDCKRQLIPLEVDLVKGYKLVLPAIKSLVLSRLKEDSAFTPVSSKEAQDLCSQWSVCESHQPSSCSDQGVRALVASLYAMSSLRQKYVSHDQPLCIIYL
jgi:hypothetical protein